MLRAGLPVQAGLIAVFLGNEGGRYVLNGALDLASVGIYAVALSVARLVLQVSQAMRTALQPRLVVAEPDAAALTVRITRHGVLLMLAVAAGLTLGAPLMGVVFGRAFAASGPVMVLMLPGMVAYGVAQLAGSHLLRAGWRGSLAWSSWAFAVGSLLFQGVGAAAAGVEGAALGLSAGYVVMAATVVGPFWKLTGRGPLDLLPGRGELRFYLGLARYGLQRIQRPATAP
jgi:O-antigen/teichoic acid export membrane protein